MTDSDLLILIRKDNVDRTMRIFTNPCLNPVYIKELAVTFFDKEITIDNMSQHDIGGRICQTI